MKITKIVSLVVALLVGLSISAVTQAGSKSTKSVSPRTLVANLYDQHKKRSPFFQTKSRALLDKYFIGTLATLLWNDAHSSGDEVGALDGDPLFNAQDMQITDFVIHEDTGGELLRGVPVTFKNFGKEHQIVFRLALLKTGWRIVNIVYEDGPNLMQILENDRAERSQQTVNVYMVAVGDDGKTGKKIGCGDSLIAVQRSIKKTKAPLAAALRELLSTPTIDGAPKLENFWKGRNLKLQSVAIRNKTATIRISGEVFVAGVCDQPRIESQIEETARQFPTVKKVKVFIGKQTLAEAIR
jgi:hypothetical protein